jgi:hypothetical protein
MVVTRALFAQGGHTTAAQSMVIGAFVELRIAL